MYRFLLIRETNAPASDCNESDQPELRFQPKDESRREAADPVLEYFKGYYYLFASKSGGYWRSEDLADWEYIPCTTIPTLEDYAPTILPVGDTLYFTTSSGKTQIFKSAHPERMRGNR